MPLSALYEWMEENNSNAYAALQSSGATSIKRSASGTVNTSTAPTISRLSVSTFSHGLTLRTSCRTA